ncbi:MAG: glycosyltransferase [Candidatus Nezhaarchaeales archaeon]
MITYCNEGIVKTCIIHYFDVCGGGEKLCLDIVRALIELGIDVELVVNSVDALNKCSSLLGTPISCSVREVGEPLASKLLRFTGRFVRLRRLMFSRRAYDAIEPLREEFDLFVDTTSNMPSKADVVYIHHPVRISTMKGYMNIIYNSLVKSYAERKLIGRPKLVLANSTWTAKLVKEVYNVDVEVLHPPVDVNFFAYDGRRKEKLIVTVSRITPEKNLHLLANAASKLKDFEWLLIGSITKEFRRVLERLRRKIEESEATNLKIITNVSKSDLREYLLRATYYVHPPFPEHFGISIAEAMAAGCIPIVYADGGAWEDLVKPIDLSLGYMRIEDVPSIVRSIEARGRDYKAYIMKKALERVSTLSYKVFRDRLGMLLNLMRR